MSIASLALILTACAPTGDASTPEPTPTAEPTPTLAPTLTPTPDYPAIRARIGPLTGQEVGLIDPALAARWAAFIGGDDSAYRPLDAQAIEALRAGAIHWIGGTLITAVEERNAVGYLVFDHQTGDPTIVGWLDNTTGDVLEASTGYRLNVLDEPGEWIEPGPEGEQFYHYGFSYYRRWRRILPDPFIAVAERFRTVGAENVVRRLDAYQQAARDYNQGDLTLIAWSTGIATEVANWTPSAASPPYLTLPDSGTVDVRRERFLAALTTRQVVVDERSVVDFLNSAAAQSGYFYTAELTEQQVLDALVMPYRSGHLYSDMEAAIILGATYGDGGPLTIRVSDRFDYGAHVPRRRNEVLIAGGELADVVLGYPGTLTARWPHEMAHLIEFRDPRNEEPVRPAGGSRCEPFKYLIEYMWWVERYPWDAPNLDWMPVGSGLTLARLLTGTYPNSGC